MFEQKALTFIAAFFLRREGGGDKSRTLSGIECFERTEAVGRDHYHADTRHASCNPPWKQGCCVVFHFIFPLCVALYVCSAMCGVVHAMSSTREPSPAVYELPVQEARKPLFLIQERRSESDWRQYINWRVGWGWLSRNHNPAHQPTVIRHPTQLFFSSQSQPSCSRLLHLHLSLTPFSIRSSLFISIGSCAFFSFFFPSICLVSPSLFCQR